MYDVLIAGGRNRPWKKLILYTLISIVALAFGVASAISIPVSLHLTNRDHEDDTFVYTAENNTSTVHDQVWLTTLSTFWYRSIQVGIKSSNVEDLHTARVYAVPLHEYHKTEVINETCTGRLFPPKSDPGLQVRYLYAHLPFSYNGCITNTIENVNSAKFLVGIFRLSNKREFERYLRYMSDGNTTFALNLTSIVTVQPGETKCAHLEMNILHTTFYYVTMVVFNDSALSYPVQYFCYSLKQYRDFDRKLHHPICNLEANKSCFYSFYNGNFINTHGKKVAIVAEVNKSSHTGVPITTVSVHSSKNSNIVNLGVIIGVIVAVVMMVIILILLLIACVRMYVFSTDGSGLF